MEEKPLQKLMSYSAKHFSVISGGSGRENNVMFCSFFSALDHKLFKQVL